MKYLRLFENFFKDMELAADHAHDPVLVDKPEDHASQEPAEVEEEPVKKPAEDSTEETEAPKPKDFNSWLSGKVKKIVELTDEPNLSKGWIELENGTSIQWELSQIDYPVVAASFKLGKDTVYMHDDTAGDLAREYYEKKREHDPKAWLSVLLKVGAQFPALLADWKKKGINRATDQDKKLGEIIAKKSKVTKVDESAHAGFEEAAENFDSMLYMWELRLAPLPEIVNFEASVPSLLRYKSPELQHDFIQLKKILLRAGIVNTNTYVGDIDGRSVLADNWSMPKSSERVFRAAFGPEVRISELSRSNMNNEWSVKRKFDSWLQDFTEAKSRL
jgi:hypothetical protein